MSTRTSSATAAQRAAAAGIPGWNDIPRQQLAAAAQAFCAVFRGFEAIRRMQEMTAHKALVQHQALADKLKEPCRPMELVAIQAEMVRFDLQGAALYWQQLASAVGAMQRELLGGTAALKDVATADRADTAGTAVNPFLFDVKGARRTAAHA